MQRVLGNQPHRSESYRPIVSKSNAPAVLSVARAPYVQPCHRVDELRRGVAGRIATSTTKFVSNKGRLADCPSMLVRSRVVGMMMMIMMRERDRDRRSMQQENNDSDYDSMSRYA